MSPNEEAVKRVAEQLGIGVELTKHNHVMPAIAKSCGTCLAVSATTKLVEIEEALRAFDERESDPAMTRIWLEKFLADVRRIVEKKG